MELISKLFILGSEQFTYTRYHYFAVPVRSFTYFDRRHLQHVHDQT